MVKTTTNVKGLANAYGVGKKSVIEYMTAIKDGTFTIEKGQTALSGYQSYLQSTGKAAQFADIKTKALSASMKVLSTIGWMLAFAAVAKGIELTTKALYKLTHQQEELSEKTSSAIEKYKELSSEIDKLNSSLAETSNRIDELNTKENLTLIEAEELDKLYETNRELERELSIKRKLAELAKQEASQAAISSITNKSEISSVDSQYRQSLQNNVTNPAGMTGNHLFTKFFTNNIFNNSTVDTDINRMDAVREKISEVTALEEKQVELKEQLEGADKKTYKQLEKQINKNQQLIDSYNAFIREKVTALQTEDDALELGTSVEGDALLKELDTFYNEVDAFLGGRATKIQQILDGLFAKEEFESIKNILLSMGKVGTLSSENIMSTISSDLLNYLNEANISAEQLFQYIKAISNPDAFNYDEVRNQVKISFQAVDENGNELTSESAKNALSIADKLTDEELTAYLTVKAKYGEEGSQFWTVRDWMANIRAEIQSVPGDDLSLSVSITSNQETIDAYQSEIKTIADALANLTVITGDASAELDLLQSILAIDSSFDIELYKDSEGVINFKAALQDLLQTITQNAKKEMPELASYIDSIAESAVNAEENISSLSDALSSLENNAKLLQTASGEMSGGAFSIGTLQDMISAYDEMEDAVGRYCAGLMTTQELFSVLEQCYKKDENNYKKLIKAKLSADTEFYKKVLKMNGTRINELAQKYGLDYKNWTSLEDAKLKAETELITKLSSLWAKYYKITLGDDGYYHLTDIQDNEAYDVQNDPAYQEATKKAEAQMLKMNALIRELENGFQAASPDFSTVDTSWQNLGSSSSSSSASSQFSEQIDFAKYRLEELEKVLDRLRSKVDNASEIGLKNHTIEQMINVEKEREEALLAALALYKKEAEAAMEDIPDAFKELAKDGTIAITDFVGTSNEKVVTAIKNYRAWTDTVAETETEIENLNKAIADLNIEKFNNIQSEYENQSGIIDSFLSQFQAQIDLFENQGYTISEKMYEQMMEKTNWQIEMLKNEREALVKQMAEMIKANPSLAKENFYEMTNAITAIDEQIISCTSSLEDFQNVIRDLEWSKLDKLADSLSSIDTELSGLDTLLGSYDLTVDGELTDYGLANFGVLAQQYELASYQAQQYSDAIEKLDAEYKAGKWSLEEYFEKLQELSDAQWSAVSASVAARDAIIQLAKARVDDEINSIEKATDAYEELIKAQIKQLKTEKDLHDFKKSITEKQNDITSIQKQLAAIANDTSRAAEAKRAQLLEEQRKLQGELDELYYDQSIKEKEDALNEELERYKAQQEEKKETLEKELEDEEALIQKYLELVNSNSSTIADVLEELAKEHGIKISDSVITPWKSGQNAISEYRTKLSSASSSFTASLEKIKSEINSMTNVADNLANSFIDMFNVNTSAFLKDLTNIAELLNLISGVADNTTQIDGDWMYDKDKGENGSWWYQHKDGGYTTDGWEKIDGKWYHFDRDGWMQTGWYQDEKGDWYYLSDGSIGKEGEMLTSTTTPDGYYVDASGKWVQSAGQSSTGSNIGSSGSSSNENSSGKYGKVSEISGNLRFGTSNTDDVKKLQYALNELGYALSIDGKFGTATLNAVKEFQKKSGISVDGIVGADTKKAFKNSGFTTGGVATEVLKQNKDDGWITVKKGETVLTDKFTNTLPRTVDVLQEFNRRYPELYNNMYSGIISSTTPMHMSHTPTPVSTSNNSFNIENIENKVIVQGSVSTENLEVLKQTMEKVADKSIDKAFRKAAEKRKFR